jgi:SnoaL-like domain
MTHDDPAVQYLLDRAAITETLYRYASCIDAADWAGVRSTLADDAVARYGDRDWLQGGDAIAEWISANSAAATWQHHLLSVYHIEIDGDSASALTYHTSHRITTGDLDAAAVIVARYRDQLARVDTTWKITKKVMEIGWRDTRRH